MTHGRTPGRRAPLFRPLRDLPIRRKLSLLVLVSSIGGLLVSAGALIQHARTTASDTASRDLHSTAQMAASTVTAALAFRDPVAAREVLAATAAKPAVEQACLYLDDDDADPVLFASFSSGAQPCPARPQTAGADESAEHMVETATVAQADVRLGQLQLHQSRRPLRAVVATQVGITLGVLLVSLAVMLSIASVLQRTFTTPIGELLDLAGRVRRSGDYGLRASVRSGDELGQLGAAINRMLEQIQTRETALDQARAAVQREAEETEHANRELSSTLERLQRTRQQLVESERLAALGGLVAGIAHEVNTPLGVGVTATSTIAVRTAELNRRYADGQLTRQELESGLAELEEFAQMALRNLERAAGLVHSFKQVAVDQSSGERRRFKLVVYLREVLVSLAPALRKTKVQARVDGDSDIELDAYPGALAQIVTNLVNNALIHAFEPDTAGRISIRIRAVRDCVLLLVSDNGRGIPARHLKRVFDPFFTTRRGSGGSGLGMHIVHNLVVQLLGGSIRIRSTEGRGTRIWIRLPVTAPRH